MIIKDDEHNNVNSKIRSKRRNKINEFNATQLERNGFFRKRWAEWNRNWFDDYNWRDESPLFVNTVSVKRDFFPRDDKRWDKFKEVGDKKPLEYDSNRARITLNYFVKGEQNRDLSDNMMKTTSYAKKEWKGRREEFLNAK
jgi:hypothetical protein